MIRLAWCARRPVACWPGFPRQLTAELLNGNQREKLDRAIEEYSRGVLEANDRGGAHLELGVCTRRWAGKPTRKRHTGRRSASSRV